MTENASVHVAVSGGPLTPEERYGKILVMGRAQTGKTTLAKKLSEMTGLKLLKTSTSRPRRTPDEDTYRFYTPEEAAAIPMEDKLFHTLAVDGFERWTGRDDFLAAGIAVLDPTAMVPAVRLWQSQGYRVCVLYASNSEEIRRTRWMKDLAADDGSDWDQVLAAFGHRESVEAPMFDRLEDMIHDIRDAAEADAMLYPNLPAERRALCGEDLFQEFRSNGVTAQEKFLPGFLQALAAGARPAGGCREFPSREDLTLDPEDWTEGQWRLLCRLFGLIPEATSHVRIARPLVKAFTGPSAKDNQYKTGGPA